MAVICARSKFIFIFLVLCCSSVFLLDILYQSLEFCFCPFQKPYFHFHSHTHFTHVLKLALEYRSESKSSLKFNFSILLFCFDLGFCGSGGGGCILFLLELWNSVTIALTPVTLCQEMYFVIPDFSQPTTPVWRI